MNYQDMKLEVLPLCKNDGINDSTGREARPIDKTTRDNLSGKINPSAYELLQLDIVTKSLDNFDINLDRMNKKKNNSQFASSYLLNYGSCSSQAISCIIALEIFKVSDKTKFTKDSAISNIIKYYTDLILKSYDNPEISENVTNIIAQNSYNLKQILTIVMSFYDVNQNDISLDIKLSIDNIYDSGYHIVKKSHPDNTIAELTPEDRFALGAAAKNYNRTIEYSKKRSKKTNTYEPILKFSEISTRDHRGRYSSKPSIILSSPDIIDSFLTPEDNEMPSDNVESDDEDNTITPIVVRNISNTNSSSLTCYNNLNHYDMLYYTTNEPVKILDWDGSHIGNFSKKEFDIVKTQETLNNKYMLLHVNGEQFWSEYIKLSDRENYLTISAIDEWKPLFGLEKLGTHSIILNNISYILFKTPDPSTIFPIGKKISDINPDMVTGPHLDQVRNILLFKYIIGCQIRGNFMRFDIEKSTFFSLLDIASCSSKGTTDLPKNIINKWLTDKLSTSIYDKDQYLRILSSHLKKILNIETIEDKEIKPSILRSNMEDIGRRINSQGESNYCISFIIERVRNLIDCY